MRKIVNLILEKFLTMELEDLQIIWETQKAQPTFSVDSETLCARLVKMDRKVKREFNQSEISSIVITFALALIIVYEPIFKNEDHHQYLSAAVFLLASIFLYLKRSKRMKLTTNFDKSIMGIVDTSIVRLKALTKWTKLWFLLFAISMVSVQISTLVYVRNISPAWKVYIVPIGIVLLASSAYCSIKKRRPKIESLESLKKKMSAKP